VTKLSLAVLVGDSVGNCCCCGSCDCGSCGLGDGVNVYDKNSPTYGDPSFSCASNNEEQITSRSHLSNTEIVLDNGDSVQILN
jgi:hypothetical protein